MINTFKRNIVLGLGISLVALIISSGASYISIQKLNESDHWVDHTFKVLQDFDYILSRMKDAETGQRGYLLTGDPVFLEPYAHAREDVAKHIDHVELLTADNRSQQKDFPYLNQLINQKYALIEQTIAQKKEGVSVTTKTLLEGKAIMDHIRAQVKVMEQREQKLMALRTSQVNVFATYTPILILFASLIAVVVTYIFYTRMRANLMANQNLQEELEKKERDTDRHIKAIGDVAEQISKGNYEVRIKKSDLE